MPFYESLDLLKIRLLQSDNEDNTYHHTKERIMQKRFYIMVLLISLFTNVSAREKDKMHDSKRRVWGMGQVATPNLGGGAHKDKKITSKDKPKKDHKEIQHQKKKKERKKAKQHKKDKTEENRYKQQDPFKAHLIMADVHKTRAKKSASNIKKIRAKIQAVVVKEKRIKKADKERVASTSRSKKEKALLLSRHAETTKDQKINDYISSRTHGTSEHPLVGTLQKKHRVLRDQLKHEAKVRKESIKAADEHYAQAGLEKVCKQEKIKQRDQDIVHGKHHKRTRKNLNESKSEIKRKKETEEKRKDHEMKREKVKKHKKYHEKKHKNMKVQKQKEVDRKMKNPTKIKPVVQKKSA